MSEFVLTYPLHIVASGAMVGEMPGTLVLSHSTNVASCETPSGKMIAIFTDRHAAEIFRDAHPEASGGEFDIISLGIAEFTCVLARMGLFSPKMAVDPNPITGYSRVMQVEPVRQQLSAKLQAAANKAGVE